MNLALGYRTAKTVLVAHRLGVFSHLSTVSLGSELVADHLGLDRRATRVLLRALVGLGLLVVKDGAFLNSELADQCLVPGKPQYVGNNLEFQELIWDCWSHLEDTVRSGKPHASLMDLLSAKESSFTREYILAMANISARTSAEVAQVLSAHSPRRMIDVGCGPGMFSLAMLDRNPELKATLFDLPTTLAVSEEVVRQRKLESRCERQPGDYTRDSFGEGYDLVLMSHITHDESPQTNASLCKKAFVALRSSGSVAIHDFVIDPATCQPPFSGLFGVNMLTYTIGGETYTVAEYTEWLEAAGFTNVVTHPIAADAPNASVLLVASKP